MKKNTVLFTTAMLSAMMATNALAAEPFRDAVETNGGSVTWDRAERRVSAEIGGNEISFVIGSGVATVNGETVSLDSAIADGRTVVDADFLNTYVFSAEQEEATNIEKALSLIGTFATGDTETAHSLLAEDYIQHNLAYGTGADAFVSSVAYLASADAETTVENIRAFAEGDYVFLQNKYNFAGAGDQAAFDIFRFDEEGKIAEHWDNLADVAALNPSGHTQFDGATAVTDLGRTEANKAVVKGFVTDVLMGEAPENITDYVSTETYIQHNTGIADGLDGLNAALAAYAEQGIEMVYDTNHMLLGEGNFVLSVSEGTLGGVHTSYYDLFRLEDGKIVEHWDVIETIADASTWANDNGKF